MQKIRKAVIPAAGYGTRMLPITKTVSKEILPVVDKPIIQIVVEELVEAGIEEIIIVNSASKTDLVDYFSEIDPGLAKHLQAGGSAKEAILHQLEAINNIASIAFIEQKGAYGTGTPVINAEPYLGGESFIYTFADDFFVARHENSFSQLLRVYDQYQSPVIACQRRSSPKDYHRYGYVGGRSLDNGLVDVAHIVEQPAKYGLDAPGDMASIGGFVVTPQVFGYLHQVRDQLMPGKELFFNAALDLMVKDGQRVLAQEVIDAEYFDTGNKLEYMKTTVSMAARHPEIGTDFKIFLEEFVKKG